MALFLFSFTLNYLSFAGHIDFDAAAQRYADEVIATEY